MPRKPRITSVPVEQVQPEEGLMVARDVPDEKTDAEQMTEILQEVKEEHKEAVSDAPVVVKPKAKRASRAKPKEEPKEEPILILSLPEGSQTKGKTTGKPSQRK